MGTGISSQNGSSPAGLPSTQDAFYFAPGSSSSFAANATAVPSSAGGADGAEEGEGGARSNYYDWPYSGPPFLTGPSSMFSSPPSSSSPSYTPHLRHSGGAPDSASLPSRHQSLPIPLAWTPTQPPLPQPQHKTQPQPQQQTKGKGQPMFAWERINDQEQVPSSPASSSSSSSAPSHKTSAPFDGKDVNQQVGQPHYLQGNGYKHSNQQYSLSSSYLYGRSVSAPALPTICSSPQQLFDGPSQQQQSQHHFAQPSSSSASSPSSSANRQAKPSPTTTRKRKKKCVEVKVKVEEEEEEINAEEEDSVDDEDDGDDEGDEDWDSSTRKEQRGDFGRQNNNGVTVPTKKRKRKKIVVSTLAGEQSDDGYRWRKYGRKTVKGSPYPRSYYKCTFPSCKVKKQVETVVSSGKTIINSIYKGEHKHERPCVTHMTAHDQQSFRNSVIQGFQNRASANSQREASTPRLIVEVSFDVDWLDDGYRWRKYGQKFVKGHGFSRSYYKCTEKGCLVKKQVDQQSHAIINTYEGSHTHPPYSQSHNARKRRRPNPTAVKQESDDDVEGPNRNASSSSRRLRSIKKEQLSSGSDVEDSSSSSPPDEEENEEEEEQEENEQFKQELQHELLEGLFPEQEVKEEQDEFPFLSHATPPPLRNALYGLTPEENRAFEVGEDPFALDSLLSVEPPSSSSSSSASIYATSSSISPTMEATQQQHHSFANFYDNGHNSASSSQPVYYHPQPHHYMSPPPLHATSAHLHLHHHLYHQPPPLPSPDCKPPLPHIYPHHYHQQHPTYHHHQHSLPPIASSSPVLSGGASSSPSSSSPSSSITTGSSAYLSDQGFPSHSQQLPP
ncbi:WRKY transcription factor [Balamuthia mandrillaris]